MACHRCNLLACRLCSLIPVENPNFPSANAGAFFPFDFGVDIFQMHLIDTPRGLCNSTARDNTRAISPKESCTQGVTLS